MNQDRKTEASAAVSMSDRLTGLSLAKKALLERRRRSKEDSSLAKPSIPVRMDRETAPLSFAQERLWLLQQILPDSFAFNVPRAMHIQGDLDRTALQKALDALVTRHEVLRTVYLTQDNMPVQKVTKNHSVQMVCHDLAQLTQEQQQQEWQRILNTAIRRPFQLDRDLLLRAELIRLGELDHRLILSSHHIASDGWSKGILFTELVELYDSFQHHRASELRELPIQYADFAAWQRQLLTGDYLQRQLSYWREKLDGAPALLELPTDHPRPPSQSYGGANYSIAFSSSLAEGLRQLSQREGTTLFMTILAAFQVLLFRYTQQPDLVLGTPVSGRNRVETEALIGDFVNVLVLRTDLSGNPTFRELLKRVRETALGAYEHAELPFEKLVAELQPARALSYSPLFQVMFILESNPPDAPQFSELKTELLSVFTETAKHDLIFIVAEDRHGLKVDIEYPTALFDAATPARMAHHFQTLLNGIVANPGLRLASLPLLSSDEERQLVVDWNLTTADYPTGAGIHHLFEAQAARTPTAIAAVYAGQKLSYAELNQRANQLARYLQSRGVRPGVLVGVHLERSLQMLIAVLATLKAGGAYVPLDPSFPKERLAFMVEDSGLDMLLTEQKLLPGPGPGSIEPLCLDSDWHRVANEDPDNLLTPVSPEDLAYVIFTSGSTGKPKGTMVTHGSVVNFLSSMAREPGLAEHDVLVAVTTLSFDIAGLELFLPLSVGARVVIAGREIIADGKRLATLLRDCGATVMQATPATWQLLLESGWQGDARLKVLCGGEMVPRTLADQLLQRCASLWNVYGPTETTIWSAVQPVKTEEGSVPIGRPIANTGLYILDHFFGLVPVGVTGELFIDGQGLARGYLNRPDLTAEKFIPNPFRSDPGARMYRTGDLARFRPDGTIECLGRNDNQVKVRGFRIELGEVEAVLSRHPDVEQTVAVVREDVPGDKRLVAYLVSRGQTNPLPAELRKFLGERLPDYMVPSHFVMLAELPRTLNGKINRRALPPPSASAENTAETFVAPTTPVEETMAAIWGQALSLSRVGTNANFFDLGGHSLLAVQVIARIRDAFGVDVPVHCLFEVPTLGELAQIVENALLNEADPDEMASLLAELDAMTES